MEKTIDISGQKVRFKSTGATMLRYKEQFGREFLQDLMRLNEAYKVDKKGNVKLADIDKLNLTPMYDIVWVLAKTADPTIPEKMEWYDSFDDFPLVSVYQELSELIGKSLRVDRKNG